MNSWTMGFKSDRYRYNFNPQQTRHKRDKLETDEIVLGIADNDEAKINECSYAYSNYNQCLEETWFDFSICEPFQKHMTKCEHQRGIYQRRLEQAIQQLSKKTVGSVKNVSSKSS
jgi:lysophospholipid acyltransferase (LPLAT)-like uncharacterized protein